MPKPRFDIVIYGATGDTGRVAARYLFNQQKSKNFTVAIAARNEEKLKALQLPFENLICDVSDGVKALEEVTKRAKVIVNCCGPYTFFGEPVIQACINTKTHYCDITGEIKWVSEMKEKYEAQASANEVAILNFCGYDCLAVEVPIYALLHELEKVKTPPQSKNQYSTGHRAQKAVINTSKDEIHINTVVGGSAKAKLPRGTLLTALNMMMEKKKKKEKQPKSFKVNTFWSHIIPVFNAEWDSVIQRNVAWSTLALAYPFGSITEGYKSHLPFITLPNFMAAVNIPVVFDSIQRNFNLVEGATLTFRDRLTVGGSIQNAFWSIFALVGAFFSLPFLPLLLLPPIQSTLVSFAKGRKNKPDTNGYTKTRGTLSASWFPNGDETKKKEHCYRKTTFSVRGDPGLQMTATLQCETALHMLNLMEKADDEKSIEDGSTLFRKGFQTPLSSMDKGFLKHLQSVDGVEVRIDQ